MKLLIHLLIIVFLLLGPAYAQEPGTLDNSFGNGGKTEIKITPSARSFAVAIQPDGKIIAAGSSVAGVTITRLNTNGSFDNTFSNDGIDTGGFSLANSILLQPDGKIIASGYSSSDPNRFAIIRYHDNGIRDLSFNGTGVVLTELSEFCHARSLETAIQPDGKIIIAGTCGYIAGMARYNPDGSLDNTFNDSGKIIQGYWSQSNTEATGIIVRADGKILITGTTEPTNANTASDFLMMLYRDNGRRDSTFGTDGAIAFDFGGKTYEYSTSSIQLPDGKIILAGYIHLSGTGADFAMAKFNPDGSIDNQFGVNGKVTTDLGGADIAKKIIIQSDGRILLGGESDKEFAIVRYNPDGDVDETFGIDGIVKTSFDAIESPLEDMALLQDGRIIAAGWSEYPPVQPFFTRRFALARYHGNWGTGIDHYIKKSEIKISPNPANDFVLIQDTTCEPLVKAQILSTNGQIVLEQSGISIHKIDVRTLPNGFYLIKLFQLSSPTLVRSLLIQK